ncbi:hypothetical protein A4R35_04875 [Thermogemmatispora tikiterensis]|uniref:Uncharacterized protein n=1 Tax=Thermogemmatispora tikiterensis TaxID=1825093 RepID=A0A328VDC7_9CHLR|nr:hypothetical protein A4R35_04875 [Thermogemmatispora tikiterensis]
MATEVQAAVEEKEPALARVLLPVYHIGRQVPRQTASLEGEGQASGVIALANDLSEPGGRLPLFVSPCAACS